MNTTIRNKKKNNRNFREKRKKQNKNSYREIELKNLYPGEQIDNINFNISVRCEDMPKLSHFLKDKKKKRINNMLQHNVSLKNFYPDNKILDKINQSVPIKEEELTLIEDFLNQTGYFRFSIYLKLMKDIENITVADIIQTYQIDEYIRQNLIVFTTRLEVFWKKSIVESMCSSYKSNEQFHNSQCFLDLNIYQTKEWGKLVLREFDRSFYSSTSPTCKHHKHNKSGCIPIWALFDGLTFGQLTTFITQLDSKYYNHWVSSTYDNPILKRPLKSWVSVIRTARNIAAHNQRLYGLKNSVVPAVIKKTKNKYFPNNKTKDIQTQLLYGILYTIKHLFLYEDPDTQSQWNSFLENLSDKIDSVPSLNTEQYGFTHKWKDNLSIKVEQHEFLDYVKK